MSDTRNRGHRRGTEQFVVEDVVVCVLQNHEDGGGPSNRGHRWWAMESVEEE